MTKKWILALCQEQDVRYPCSEITSDVIMTPSAFTIFPGITGLSFYNMGMRRSGWDNHRSRYYLTGISRSGRDIQRPVDTNDDTGGIASS